ncbi:hypothetical protein CUMW_231050 [Citrus unshiu]|nr:hypothetical protein CUMW_231050 [Citrus unshiu]
MLQEANVHSVPNYKKLRGAVCSWCYGVKDKESRIISTENKIGFLYLRYAADPKTLWNWFEQYLKDEEGRDCCWPLERQWGIVTFPPQ